MPTEKSGDSAGRTARPAIRSELSVLSRRARRLGRTVGPHDSTPGPRASQRDAAFEDVGERPGWWTQCPLAETAGDSDGDSRAVADPLTPPARTPAQHRGRNPEEPRRHPARPPPTEPPPAGHQCGFESGLPGGPRSTRAEPGAHGGLRRLAGVGSHGASAARPRRSPAVTPPGSSEAAFPGKWEREAAGEVPEGAFSARPPA